MTVDVDVKMKCLYVSLCIVWCVLLIDAVDIQGVAEKQIMTKTAVS